VPGPHGYVLAVAFAPDSRTLAASGGDGAIWLWDVTNPAKPGVLASLNASTAGIYGLGFDPARPSLLASSGLDHTAKLWETDPQRVADAICASAGDPITPEEWSRYVPSTPLVSPCP
jgi:WD40 repeat protein